MYTIEPFQLTPNTLVYRIKLGDQFVAQHVMENSAKNLVRCFLQYNVHTKKEWRQFVPHGVKLMFIQAFSAEEPNLPDVVPRELANVHPVTGIHYGCLPHKYLFPDIYDDIMDVLLSNDAALLEGKFEGISVRIIDDLIFITESPRITNRLLCSPCAPNAGDLLSPINDENGFTTYDIPRSWRQ